MWYHLTSYYQVIESLTCFGLHYFIGIVLENFAAGSACHPFTATEVSYTTSTESGSSDSETAPTDHSCHSGFNSASHITLTEESANSFSRNNFCYFSVFAVKVAGTA